MDKKSGATASVNRRSQNNGNYWKSTPNPETTDYKGINDDRDRGRSKGYEDVRSETVPEKDSLREEPLVPRSRRNNTIAELTNSSKYSRVLSEPHVGYGPLVTTSRPKLVKRTLSATEFRTRLACPKGLLITTEPPKSGDSYRRRSNTDVFTTTRTTKRNHDSNSRKDSDLTNIISQTGKELILLELESVKHERYRLQKENERLYEELDNRNKVIDHLVDYMKSSVPEEMRNLEDAVSDINTPPSENEKMTSFSKV